MHETLAQWFLPLCGQYAPHVWTPGGVALPCCQRCTGLYAGVFAALVLWAFSRPGPGRAGLAIHALMLLQMIPLGLHWVPQGPVLRCWSGLWLGFAAVYFLGAAPARWRAARQGSAHRWHAEKGGGTCRRLGPAIYVGGLILTMILVPSGGVHGGRAAWMLLALAATAGALGLGALILANLILASAWGARRWLSPRAATNR